MTGPFGPIRVEQRGYTEPTYWLVALVGRDECNGMRHDYNRSGTCGEGHRGRAVGKAFKVSADGSVHYTGHLWCCENCMVEHSSAPDAYDAPRESYLYPTCFAWAPECDVFGDESVGPRGGTCTAREGENNAR